MNEYDKLLKILKVDPKYVITMSSEKEFSTLIAHTIGVGEGKSLYHVGVLLHDGKLLALYLYDLTIDIDDLKEFKDLTVLIIDKCSASHIESSKLFPSLKKFIWDENNSMVLFDTKEN